MEVANARPTLTLVDRQSPQWLHHFCSVVHMLWSRPVQFCMNSIPNLHFRAYNLNCYDYYHPRYKLLYIAYHLQVEERQTIKHLINSLINRTRKSCIKFMVTFIQAILQLHCKIKFLGINVLIKHVQAKDCFYQLDHTITNARY